MCFQLPPTEFQSHLLPNPKESTVFENHRKSLIQQSEVCGQTVLPDRSILIGQ